jgi:hypothetical protein
VFESAEHKPRSLSFQSFAVPSTVPSRRLRVAMSSLMEQIGHDQQRNRKRLTLEHLPRDGSREGVAGCGVGCEESEAQVRRNRKQSL